MKTLIYGAGVIGSIFAGKLAMAGHDITVLARGKRFAEIQQNGIVLQKPNDIIQEKVAVKLIDTLKPNDIYDYIIVAVQGTQIDDILPIISSNLSANIVMVVNTAKGYDKWVNEIGSERLMIGFPSAGGERKNGTVMYFIGHGIQRIFQTTTFGEYRGKKTDRIEALITYFQQAGIPSVFCSNMDAWQKTHVALVTVIANALYGFNCDNVKLSQSYQDVRDMVIAIKEGRHVLRTCGVFPTPFKLCWLNLPTTILSIIFFIFLKTELAQTTMVKHCLVAKDEMIHLQKEFDELIQQSDIQTPMIDKLQKNLFML